MINILIFALGILLGGFIVYKFNPPDTVINGRNKVKRGGRIDFSAKAEPKKKRKLFKRRKQNDKD